MPFTTIDAGAKPGTALTHSFEIALAALCLHAGVRLAMRHGHLQLTPQDTVAPVLVWSWSIALVVGALAMVLGLMWRGTGAIGRAVEKAGLLLQLSVWVSFAGVTLWVSPGWSTVDGLLQAAVVIFGCVGRFIALVKTDRAVERINAVLEQDNGG